MALSDLQNLDFGALQFDDFVRAPAAVKAIMMTLIFGIIVGAGYFGLWSGLLDQIAAAQSSEASKKTLFTEKKKQAFHLEMYEKRLVELERSLAALLNQLPNVAEVDALLTDINQAGIGRGLEFQLFKPGKEKLEEDFASMPVTIKVNGGFHDLAYFVSDLAKLPRIVTVENISLVPAKNDALTMDATINTYRYLDPSERAGPAKGKGRGKKGAAK